MSSWHIWCKKRVNTVHLKVRFDKVIWESPKIWRKMVRDLLSKAIIIQFWYQKMAKTVSKKHEQYQNTFLNKYRYNWVYLIAKIAQIKQNHWNSSWDGLESKSKFLGFPKWLYQTGPLGKLDNVFQRCSFLCFNCCEKKGKAWQKIIACKP